MGDMRRVSSLLIGLLDGFGHRVERSCQSAAHGTRIETADFVLRAERDSTRIRLGLTAISQPPDGRGRETAALLARIVRALCPAFEPQSIRWNDEDTAHSAKEWLCAFQAPPSRRAASTRRSGETVRRHGAGVAVWPDRPQDFVPEPRTTLEGSNGMPQPARYLAWSAHQTPPPADNRFAREPLPLRICSWTLTATAAALFPPAGASMAVLNITKRANLRLNLHVLTLTLVILSLHESGALAVPMRSLGF